MDHYYYKISDRPSDPKEVPQSIVKLSKKLPVTPEAYFLYHLGTTDEPDYVFVEQIDEAEYETYIAFKLFEVLDPKMVEFEPGGFFW